MACSCSMWRVALLAAALLPPPLATASRRLNEAEDSDATELPDLSGVVSTPPETSGNIFSGLTGGQADAALHRAARTTGASPPRCCTSEPPLSPRVCAGPVMQIELPVEACASSPPDEALGNTGLADMWSKLEVTAQCPGEGAKAVDWSIVCQCGSQQSVDAGAEAMSCYKPIFEDYVSVETAATAAAWPAPAHSRSAAKLPTHVALPQGTHVVCACPARAHHC